MSKEGKKTKTTTVDENMPTTSKEQETPEIKYKHAEEHPDFPEFILICKASGTLTQEFTDLGIEDRRKFETGFWQWVKAGKPKPPMPEIPQSKVKAIVDIWRVKARGKEFMFHDHTGGKKEFVEERNGKIVKYLQEFDANLMKEWLSEREQVTDIEQPVHQYIIFDTKTYLIREEDLLKPFDQVVEGIKTGKTAA